MGDGGLTIIEVDPRATFDGMRRHIALGTTLTAVISGQNAVEIEALGATVRLSDGREMLDFGSYGVTLLGHRHPAVTTAVAHQLERMPTATRVLGNPLVARFAATLVERTGGRLQRVWLGSDGADVVELAIKLARRKSGRMRILAVQQAFHGKTMGALALTANPDFRRGLEPLLGNVTHLDPTDPDAAGRELAAGDVAALIFEPIQGEAGARVLDREVLARWADDARAAGAYIISDEIQAGLRRCGPFSPALAAGLEPDALLFGKALAGGVLPLSALVASDALHEPLYADPMWHTSTFGGHPLACAAGLAALDAIEAAAADAAVISERLEEGLRALVRDWPSAITAVHGAGLLWGLECANAPIAGALLTELALLGLLVSPCLSAPETVRLLPPMVTTAAQLDQALAILAEAIVAAATYAPATL